MKKGVSYLFAIVVCLVIIILWSSFVTIGLGFNHGGGIFMYGLLFMILIFVWRAITKHTSTEKECNAEPESLKSDDEIEDKKYLDGQSANVVDDNFKQPTDVEVKIGQSLVNDKIDDSKAVSKKDKEYNYSKFLIIAFVVAIFFIIRF